jgi:hypothetical protein
MTLTRRSLFASALAAVVAAKFKRAAAAVEKRLPWRKHTVSVGPGGDCMSIREALTHVQDGGIVYLMPGVYENINGDWTAAK